MPHSRVVTEGDHDHDWQNAAHCSREKEKAEVLELSCEVGTCCKDFTRFRYFANGDNWASGTVPVDAFVGVEEEEANKDKGELPAVAPRGVRIVILHADSDCGLAEIDGVGVLLSETVEAVVSSRFFAATSMAAS